MNVIYKVYTYTYTADYGKKQFRKIWLNKINKYGNKSKYLFVDDIIFFLEL